MRVVIFGNGEWISPRAVKSSLKKGDHLVACDGGYKKAKKAGIHVHAVVGDLDSLKSKEIDPDVRILAFSAEKDKTDAELALGYAIDMNPEKILWYGALGERWDHSLTNLFLLVQAAKKNVPAELAHGNWRAFLVLKSCRIRGGIGDRVSLIPLSNAVRDVWTRGLKYSLNGETLYVHKTRGISNVLASKEAAVKVKRGWLLVLHEKLCKS